MTITLKGKIPRRRALAWPPADVGQWVGHGTGVGQMAKHDDALNDGTQASAFDDALSGPASESVDDFQLTRVASPVKPDSSRVRELMDAELGGDPLGDVQTPPPAPAAEPIAPAPPLGMLPRQRTRPGLRGYRPQLKLPRISMPQPGSVRRVKPSAGSTGIILAVLLMIAFAVLAIEFVTSLVSSIVGAFS